MATDLIKSPNIPQTFIHNMESAFWVGLVNSWPSALKWERFWDIKARGSQPSVVLASVTTALHYDSRYTASK